MSADERAGSLRADVARVARILACAGLVEAFGHVSARTGDGAFVITPTTTPLGAMTADLVVGPDDAAAPLETPLHSAIYARRDDVGAICRTHSRAAVAYGARGEVPPLVHGLGGLAGDVREFDAPDLVVEPDVGEAAGAALADGDALILHRNGALTVGPDLETACVRAYHLEERARVALDTRAFSHHLSGGVGSERARYFPVETARAWRWLAWRFLGAEPTDPRDPED